MLLKKQYEITIIYYMGIGNHTVNEIFYKVVLEFLIGSCLKFLVCY